MYNDEQGSGSQSSSNAQNQQILDALLNDASGLPATIALGVGVGGGDGVAGPSEDLRFGGAPQQTVVVAGGPSTVTSRRGPRQSVCIRCRRSKLRCDRQWPCLHCKRHNITCQYPAESALGASGAPGGADVRSSGFKRRQSDVESYPVGADVASGMVVGVGLAHPGAVQPYLSWSDQAGWRDHLFSFFGADRAQAQRQIVSLFRRIPRWIYADHIYHFVHMLAPIRAIVRPDERADVHPALMYALVAYGLRMSLVVPATGMIPREGVPVIEDDGHPANQLQREAETMLAQTLTDQSVGVEHSLSVAQAAAMIMKLQPELSHRYVHYQNIVLSLTQTPLFRQHTDGLSERVNGITFTGSIASVANEQFVKRDNVRQEEAARIRLIVIWSSFRGGFVYPNIEVLRGRFKREDWLGATVFVPFADEPRQRSPVPTSPKLDKRYSSPSDLVDDLRYDIGAEDASGLMRTVSFKSRALNSIWRCASSWQVRNLDYTRPVPEFEDILQQIDQGDDSIVMMQRNLAEHAAPSLMHRTYFAKRVVAIAFLQGYLIRRIGFAHCAALRNDVVKALLASRNGAPTVGYLKSFVSPVFKAWLHLMTTFLNELEYDYQSRNVAATSVNDPRSRKAADNLPRISHFSLDSLSLYAAASQQYSDGVAQTFAILGHPDPPSHPLALALRESSQGLRAKVQRHRTIHMQCGNPRKMIDRAVFLE